MSAAQKRVSLREKRKQKERDEQRESIGARAGTDATRAELMGDRFAQEEEKEHDALANALRLAEQTQTVGTGTIVKLKGQSEQMEKVSDDLGETNDSLVRSERILSGMKSIGSTFMNAFRSKPKETAGEVKEQRTMKKGDKDIKGYDRNEAVGKMCPSQSRVKGTEKEQVEDEQLDMLGVHLKSIRVMAEDINDELDYQSDLLETIDGQMDQADAKMEKNNRRMRKLIGK